MPADRHLAVLIWVDTDGGQESYPGWLRKPRHFVKRDEELLREILPFYNFDIAQETVTKKAQFEALLRQLASGQYKDYGRYRDYETFLLIISGYGIADTIYCQDNTVDIYKSFQDFFKGSVCPALVGKSKICLVQACDHCMYHFEGDGGDDDVDAGSMPSWKEPPKDIVAELADMVYVLCNIPGSTPWRRNAPEKKGSMFLEYFCQILSDWTTAIPIDFEELVRKVIRKINSEMESEAKELFKETGHKVPVRKISSTKPIELKKRTKRPT